MTQHSTRLFKTEGSSDKQYNVHLEPQGGGFIVYGMNGRRGGTLKQQLKTTQPVTLEEATSIFHKLVAKKKKDGYTEDESGQRYVGTDLAGRASGLLPMLLNPIDEGEASYLIENDMWGMELKHDGERRMVRYDGGVVVGINRKGLTVPLPAAIVESVLAADPLGLTILDGEMIGEQYVVFDVLAIDGESLRSAWCGARVAARRRLEARMPGLTFTATATDPGAKRAMLERARATNQEGVVFKRLDAPYSEGRPASGGHALKLKFVETASVRVCSQAAGKRSVGMEVLDTTNGQWVFVGNVTVPAGQPVPALGDVAEVRYLYAYEAGSLFQPVLLGIRRDLEASDCVRSQLKFKAAPALAA